MNNRDWLMEKKNLELGSFAQNQELENKNNELLGKLEEQEQTINELKKKNNRQNRITANQQLLILHFMGLLDSFKFSTNEKQYDLFHYVIDKNKQAVKEFITYRNGKDSKVFNEKDLNKVCEIFSEAGLIEFSDKVKLELEKFK